MECGGLGSFPFLKPMLESFVWKLIGRWFWIFLRSYCWIGLYDHAFLIIFVATVPFFWLLLCLQVGAHYWVWRDKAGGSLIWFFICLMLLIPFLQLLSFFTVGSWKRSISLLVCSYFGWTIVANCVIWPLAITPLVLNGFLVIYSMRILIVK